MVLDPGEIPSLDWLEAHYPKLLSSGNLARHARATGYDVLDRLPIELQLHVIHYVMPNLPSEGVRINHYRRYRMALHSLHEVLPALVPDMIKLVVKQCKKEAIRIEKAKRDTADTAFPPLAFPTLLKRIVRVSTVHLESLVGEALLLGATLQDIVDEKDGGGGGVLYRVLKNCHSSEEMTWDWIWDQMNFWDGIDDGRG